MIILLLSPTASQVDFHFHRRNWLPSDQHYSLLNLTDNDGNNLEVELRLQDGPSWVKAVDWLLVESKKNRLPKQQRHAVQFENLTVHGNGVKGLFQTDHGQHVTLQDHNRKNNLVSFLSMVFYTQDKQQSFRLKNTLLFEIYEMKKELSVDGSIALLNSRPDSFFSEVRKREPGRPNFIGIWTKRDRSGGVVSVGALNSNLFKVTAPSQTIRLNSSSEVTLQVTGIRLANQQSVQQLAVLNTVATVCMNNSAIVLPNQWFDKLVQTAGCDEEEEWLSCSQDALTLALEFQLQEEAVLQFKLSDYVLQKNLKNSVVAIKRGDRLLFGMPLFQRYYMSINLDLQEITLYEPAEAEPSGLGDLVVAARFVLLAIALLVTGLFREQLGKTGAALLFRRKIGQERYQQVQEEGLSEEMEGQFRRMRLYRK